MFGTPVCSTSCSTKGGREPHFFCVFRENKKSRFSLKIRILRCFAFLMWCHQESNRGHKDFQSFALPTELWHHHFLFASAKVRPFFDNAKFFERKNDYFSCKGFQPCAFNSNSCPSRVMRPHLSSGFVMWPITFTPLMVLIFSCSVKGTVKSNS